MSRDSCIFDTNGDGNCGRFLCAYCYPENQPTLDKIEENFRVEDLTVKDTRRSCCETLPGSRHERWCEKSTSFLEGYEKRIYPREDSEEARTSQGNTATILSRRSRSGRTDLPGIY